MTKSPILNAFAASFYITLIALFMYFGTKHIPREDTVLAPIAMISLFTLSAALMGYFFCYTPLQLYFDGKKKQAVQLFLQTVAVFGVFTIVMLTLLFLGVGSGG